MGEKLLTPERLQQEKVGINMAAMDYYRNGPYLAVKRSIDNCSQLDLLPLYSWFARSKYVFDKATWIAGGHDQAEVRLAELFLEDSVCSLDTLTFDCSQLDTHVAGAPTLYTIGEAYGRIREKSDGAFLDVTLGLASLDSQAEIEVSVIEQALASSDIAYRHKKKSTAPELYLGTFKAPEGFRNTNVDEFLDALLREAPLSIQTEPFVIQAPPIAA